MPMNDEQLPTSVQYNLYFLIIHGAQAADEALPPVLESLEAATCALLLMGAPDAPPGVVQEEVVEEVLALLKHNLQHNVYCFVDGAARQLYRPCDAGATLFVLFIHAL